MRNNNYVAYLQRLCFYLEEVYNYDYENVHELAVRRRSQARKPLQKKWKEFSWLTYS